jgi:hypothetical protein
MHDSVELEGPFDAGHSRSSGISAEKSGDDRNGEHQTDDRNPHEERTEENDKQECGDYPDRCHQQERTEGAEPGDINAGETFFCVKIGPRSASLPSVAASGRNNLRLGTWLLAWCWSLVAHLIPPAVGHLM